ncbi:hypothetical protein Cgig2_019016 [Carnegiea gigantea]|uniref:Uncharacterized protein n=1 Tax=Carnegiea gigantea TaxID=171969 RepID=A0A9Q1GYI9_9CARY|nr:hypothetical protein Cgig2_019016 [Carnegiea gigantea]
MKKAGPVIDDQDGKAIQKTPGLHFNSNSNQADERSRDKDEECIHSESRTKTACFSQNGFSEEVLKLSQHLHHLGKEEQLPPGFEKVSNYEANYLDLASTNPIALETDENQLEGRELQAQHIHEVQPPPGFGLPITLKPPAFSKQHLKVKGSKHFPRRSINSKGSKAHPDVPQSLSQTSESLMQIVKESLQIGKLLGISVTYNEKAALSRITKILKKNKTGPTSKPNDEGYKGPTKQ